MSKKILVTGAGGFIGGYIVKEALKRGYETWAAVRKTTSREYLTDERIRFLELDFSDADTFKKQLGDAIAENGRWDYIIHNLGATKAVNFLAFNTVNYDYLKLFVDTLISLEAQPQAFLMMSSLSAVGGGDEDTYEPIPSRPIPHPETKYGVSKLKAETYLQCQSTVPYIIFRTTGVYGPHEKDYYLMFKSIKKGFDFSVGFKRQLLTFIYVEDLTRAMLDALESGKTNKVYNISEDKAYTQKEFRDMAKKALGKKFVLPVVCPLFIVKIVCAISDYWGTITMKPSTLNRDKYNILKVRNWSCDVSEAKKDFGFKIEYPLERGIEEAVKWYKQEGWL